MSQHPFHTTMEERVKLPHAKVSVRGDFLLFSGGGWKAVGCKACMKTRLTLTGDGDV